MEVKVATAARKVATDLQKEKANRVHIAMQLVQLDKVDFKSKSVIKSVLYSELNKTEQAIAQLKVQSKCGHNHISDRKYKYQDHMHTYHGIYCIDCGLEIEEIKF